jgi:putative ABC transport system substrate-binding protein
MWSLPVTPQPAAKTARLCFIEFDGSRSYDVFFGALQALDRAAGRTVTVDRRSAAGKPDRYPQLVRECIDARSDVIVAQTTPAAQVAKAATSTIPIVMLNMGDAIGTGLVPSLARPGGNVTGMTFMAPAVAGKRVELLKEAVPSLSRLLLLSYPQDPIDAGQVKEVERVASAVGLSVTKREIGSPADLAPALDAGAAAGVQAVAVTLESIFLTRRREVLEYAARKRWPGVYPFREYVEDGGLIFYGHRVDDLHRRAADFVDRILKGANPADLPVEQPTKFDLVVNLKAAAALGLAIPPSILARANEVIE